MRETNHLTHGLFVRALPGLRLRDKRVERLARKVRVAMAWLEPSDYPAVRAWAEMEYLSNQVYATLASMGVLNRQGEARRLLSEYRQLRATQVVLARELGMPPLSRATLKLNTTRSALDLPSAMIDGVIEVGESRKRDREASAKSRETEGVL
jgi:hypothetical protein